MLLNNFIYHEPIDDIMKAVDQIPEELLDSVNDFAKSLEWVRRLPVYEVYKWWARRYSGIVRLFLVFSDMDYKHIKDSGDYSNLVRELYYNPPKVDGKKLLDPFVGGGSTLIEGSVVGYDPYGIEINRLACIGLEAIRDLPSTDLNSFEYEIRSVINSLLDIWTTKCHNGHDAIIVYTFLAWKKENGELQIRINRVKGNIYFCEKCNKLIRGDNLDKCPDCENEFNKKLKRREFYELSPYAIEYYCPVCNTKSIKSPDPDDIRKYNSYKIDRITKIPRLTETNRLFYAGIEYFEELFTPRQYITIKSFMDHFRDTPYEKIAKVVVSNVVRFCSILACFSNSGKKVLPAFVIKSYWLPTHPVEFNPIAFKNKNGLTSIGGVNIISSLNKLKKAKEFMVKNGIEPKYKIYCGPSQDIIPTLNETFDIVFTDPPYGDYQYYTDLSILGLSMIGEYCENMLSHTLQKEVVLRDKNLKGFQIGLYDVFSKAISKLSDEGKIITTFHHHNEKVLYGFIEVFKNLPIRLHAIYPVIGESSGGTLYKRKLYLDLILVFGKKKQSIHYAFTKLKFTEYDEKLQNSILKLIDFYER